MTDTERYEIKKNPEYDEYMKALCRLASGYVARIRVQFAERALEKFQDETTRRIVLEYGKQCEKLDRDRLRNFCYYSDFGGASVGSLEDSCLNNASAYGATIKLLFDIQ